MWLVATWFDVTALDGDEQELITSILLITLIN